MAKESWVKKLKQWEKDQDEAVAKALMSPPLASTILKSIPLPGVVIIMGARGKGKSALAHEIMAQFNKSKGIGGVLLRTSSLPAKQRKLLPKWISVVHSISALPMNKVCLIDESAQVAHARRSQSGQAIKLDNLVSISRQRNQLIIFISHHSRKLDINLIHDSDVLLWKEPTEAHAIFERDELQLFTRKALEFFRGIKGTKARLKATYVTDLHHMRFHRFNNGLPKWWSAEMSNGFQDSR